MICSIHDRTEELFPTESSRVVVVHCDVQILRLGILGGQGSMSFAQQFHIMLV